MGGKHISTLDYLWHKQGWSPTTKKGDHLFVGLCPIHQEHTASFLVNLDNSWHCFHGGGQGGYACHLIMELENMSEEAAKKRAEELYATRLKLLLEAEHTNEFVAIEPVSGDFFLGKTLSEAIGAAGSRLLIPGSSLPRESATCPHTVPRPPDGAESAGLWPRRGGSLRPWPRSRPAFTTRRTS